MQKLTLFDTIRMSGTTCISIQNLHDTRDMHPSHKFARRVSHFLLDLLTTLSYLGKQELFESA